MDDIERRAFVRRAALGTLAFTVGGAEVLLWPHDARAQGVPFRTLTPEQAASLEAVAEALVPGARAAGVAHFVDQQISIPPDQALLEARILNIRPPFASFYRDALAAIEGASRAAHDGRPFAKLTADEQHALLDRMRQAQIAGWQTPPAPLVYTVLRSDAIDVVYGTMDGYARLAIPYKAHIAPRQTW